MEDKKVSIMMPAYNAMPLIKASVASIISQTYTNWECIIVDDGSTDGTSEYLDSLKDTRFIVHHFEINKGRPAARQKALELTTGYYVTMLDAEDLMSVDRIESQVRYLKENQDVVLVSSCIFSFGTKTEIVRVRGPIKNEKIVYDGHNSPNHASSMLYGDLARQYRYNPMLTLGQDQDFLKRYLLGRCFLVVSDVHYYYSEFDSVNKHKIIRTYKLSAKKSWLERNLKDCSIYILKYIYGKLFYPFLSIESILLKRGRTPTQSQLEAYKEECRNIVENLNDFNYNY